MPAQDLSLLRRDALAVVVSGQSGGPAFTWWAPLALLTRRRDKDSNLLGFALPDYLITLNILCLATAQMQTEIREFPAGSCNLSAHRCLIQSRKSRRTNGLGKNASHGD